ncbi:class C sortase [Enterococcus sp. CSURQ0835]|uniref:class C sortase n=1 Tax=Enterococcus sp. CSURQ0835 TaxID=2681394 RepID=UPI001F466D79|nr:class C sortase [Enterococcus sp. CSURQ0835]
MAKNKLTKGSKKQLLSRVFMTLVFLAGVLIMLYPFYVNALNTLVDQQRLTQLEKNNAAESQRQKALIKKRMQQQNEALKKNGLVPRADPFTDTNEKKLASDQYLKEHLIGAVSIPTIKLTVPLFDQTDDRLLQTGATVLQGTSYPTGGNDTHSVISAHSGLPEKKLFTDLEEVKKGDLFVLTVFDKKLAYRVETLKVVKPENTSVLKIEPGRDLVTLLTCTPYMINSHRLLVTGYRVPYTEKIAKQVQQADQKQTQNDVLILLGVAAIVLLLLFNLYRIGYSYRLKKRRFDLTLVRQSATGAPQQNIMYGLYTKTGKPVICDQIPVTGQTDATGKIVFKDLPGAVYLVKEQGTSGIVFKAGLKKIKQVTPQVYPSRQLAPYVTVQPDQISLKK